METRSGCTIATVIATGRQHHQRRRVSSAVERRRGRRAAISGERPAPSPATRPEQPAHPVALDARGRDGGGRRRSPSATRNAEHREAAEHRERRVERPPAPGWLVGVEVDAGGQRRRRRRGPSAGATIDQQRRRATISAEADLAGHAPSGRAGSGRSGRSAAARRSVTGRNAVNRSRNHSAKRHARPAPRRRTGRRARRTGPARRAPRRGRARPAPSRSPWCGSWRRTTSASAGEDHAVRGVDPAGLRARARRPEPPTASRRSRTTVSGEADHGERGQHERRPAAARCGASPRHCGAPDAARPRGRPRPGAGPASRVVTSAAVTPGRPCRRR